MTNWAAPINTRLILVLSRRTVAVPSWIITMITSTDRPSHIVTW